MQNAGQVPSGVALYPGFDFSTFLSDASGNVTGADLDLSFTPIVGPRVAIETVLRKLLCPPSSMDDQNWGIDLKTYLNAGLTSGDLAGLQAAIRTEILKEEYVEDCTVTCLLSLGGDGRLIVDIGLTLADLQQYTFAFSLGPDSFRAVLDVASNANG